MKCLFYNFFWILSLMFCSLGIAAAASPAQTRIERKIQFWRYIYRDVSTKDCLIHDSRIPELIYELVPKNSGYTCRERRKFWQKTLKNWMQHPPSSRDPVHSCIQNLWQKDHPGQSVDYGRLSHDRGVRFQRGLKEEFEIAQQRAKKLLPKLEKIFRSHGVPEEWASLPYVESSFNVQALSKVGASGIFQLMPYVVRRPEDRDNPITAAHAAARLLRENFRLLKDWPLAITAYNFGKSRIHRLMLQSDSLSLEDLVLKARYRGFGFASQNFYPSLKAAIELSQRNSDLLLSERIPNCASLATSTP